MKISGAHKILSCLLKEGVTTIFGYPGGAVLPLYDALVDVPQIKHVLFRHEQAAIHAADGYARASGDLGVCLATSGPGITNMITGLATALMDSVPLVVLSGQVPSTVMGTDAFQEVDALGLSFPVTKHSFLLQGPQDIPLVIHEACQIARSGRPGPILIDCPKDFLSARNDYKTCCEGHDVFFGVNDYCSSYVGESLKLINDSQRPVIYVGGGGKKASREIKILAEHFDIPVTTTLMSLGTFPTTHMLFLGMPGMHGTEKANHALDQADLVVAVGARFDDRVTGQVSKFSKHSKKIQIDCDDYEMNKNISVDLCLLGDTKTVLQELLMYKGERKSHSQWHRHLSSYSKKALLKGASSLTKVSPPLFFDMLNRLLPEDAYIVTDVGQHQMWCAQCLDYHFPGSLVTSGGLGTMGFGLPASLGVKLAKPDQEAIAIVGDGGFQMTLQELVTFKKYKIGAKIIVLDNACLGMVRQWQELFHQQKYSEIDLSDNPDFVSLAHVYGWSAWRLDCNEGLQETLSRFLNSKGPSLLHVLITEDHNVYPIVPPGEGASIMWLGPKGEKREK